MNIILSKLKNWCNKLNNGESHPCRKCGKLIYLNKEGSYRGLCPHCKTRIGYFSEPIEDTLHISDSLSVIRIFEKVSPKKLWINLALMFSTSLLGFFFTGIWGVLIGFFVGVIVFIKAPPYRETGVD